MVSKRAFERVPFRGLEFDRITREGVLHLEYLLGAQVVPSQGPYGTFGASMGTHTGSGAVDFPPVKGKTTEEVLKAGRLAGWALYRRPRLVRNGAVVWNEHFHGIQLGNPNISDEARRQVQDYYAGLDALASHLPDKDQWRPNPIVKFRYPLGQVNLGMVHKQATGSTLKPLTSVRHIQRTLNLKSGTDLLVDGIYGAKTKRAYARWEKQNGGDGDGVPAPFALKLLGAARFRVVGEPT